MVGKLGTPGFRNPASTTISKGKLNVVDPEVPTTSKEYVPAGVPAVLKILKFVLEPADTGFGLNEAFIPAGNPLVEKDIGLLKLPNGVVLIV